MAAVSVINDTGGRQRQMKDRLSYRFLVVHIFIALISPRVIGQISARRNSGTSTITNALPRNIFTRNGNGNGNGISRDMIRRGHSHNDYHQNDPLKSALLHGLMSVEVDVFPLEGELFVAHTRLELDVGKTIDNM
jgi:hypothetical protein